MNTYAFCSLSVQPYAADGTFHAEKKPLPSHLHLLIVAYVFVNARKD